MTDFTSPVYRRTYTDDGRSRKGRRIVVGLVKGDLVSVREERCSEEFFISARELLDVLEYREAKSKLASNGIAAPMPRKVGRGGKTG